VPIADSALALDRHPSADLCATYPAVWAEDNSHSQLLGGQHAETHPAHDHLDRWVHFVRRGVLVTLVAGDDLRQWRHCGLNAHDGGMARPSPNGRQVILEVRVWYDESTKRVHLSSTDPDLGPKGLHMNIKPGSTPDVRLRELLTMYGKPAG
jgi:hypothetical protein